MSKRFISIIALMLLFGLMLPFGVAASATGVEEEEQLIHNWSSWYPAGPGGVKAFCWTYHTQYLDEYGHPMVPLSLFYFQTHYGHNYVNNECNNTLPLLGKCGYK